MLKVLVWAALGFHLALTESDQQLTARGKSVTAIPESLQHCFDSQHSSPNQATWCDGKGRHVNMASGDDDGHASARVPSGGSVAGQHIRSPLARAIYYKMREDEENKNNRHVYWYRVIVGRLNPDLQTKFIQLDQDKGTDDFLEHCTQQSDQLFTQLFHSIARPIMNIFMSQTSINGFLNRGSMFIFSQQHIEKFLNVSPYQKGDNLLDLGAGDGKVTAVLSPYFKNTYATEISSVMVRRLRGQGFKVLGLDEWQNGERKYDLIACLNLIDRCDKPMTLLAEIKASLTPITGRLLLAVVIPFRQYVEFESRTHEPSEVIRIRGTNFEEEVEQFHRLFDQAGFEVESFTRLPYLCEGDLRHSFYVITDAMFLLKSKDS